MTSVMPQKEVLPSGGVGASESCYLRTVVSRSDRVSAFSTPTNPPQPQPALLVFTAFVGPLSGVRLTPTAAGAPYAPRPPDGCR